MNLDNLNKWLALTANLGVIAGILFLALEISQNTKAIQADIYQNRSFEFANSFEFLAESQYLLPAIVSAQDDNRQYDLEILEGLSELEKRRLWMYVEAQMRRNDNNLYQCEIGYLDEQFCSSLRMGMPDRVREWQNLGELVGRDISPMFYRLLEVTRQ